MGIPTESLSRRHALKYSVVHTLYDIMKCDMSTCQDTQKYHASSETTNFESIVVAKLARGDSTVRRRTEQSRISSR